MSDLAHLTSAQLAALRAIDSPTIANAIEEFDARDRRAGYMDSSIRCLYPELGEIVGYAFTITFKNREPHDPPMRQQWVNALEHAAEVPTPRIMVAHDASPDVPAALFGEIMCTLLKRLEFVGVITNGAVRDVNEVRALGLQYFASGVDRFARPGNGRIFCHARDRRGPHRQQRRPAPRRPEWRRPNSRRHRRRSRRQSR